MHKFELIKLSRSTTCLIVIISSFASAQCLSAATVTVTGNTNTGNGQIAQLDTSTNTVTTELDAGALNHPDSLVFDGPGQILYTVQGSGGGQVALLNTSTGSNSVIATLTLPGFGFIKDLTLDPGATSVSVSLSGSLGQSLDRVNLATHAVTTLVSGDDIRGLTYDSSGHLFAVVNGAVSQLDPATGLVLKSSALLPSTGSAGAQGITFDPSTGMLFVTNDTNNLSQRGVYELPTSLISATLLSATSAAGLFGDGLTADGKGDLFITDANFIDEYNIAGGVLTPGTATILGVQDVALNPSSGPPPPPTPEPGTMSLFGISLLGVGTWRLRRKARK